MKQLAGFVAASAVAAVANLVSRVALSLFVPYAAAIVGAFCVGVSTAFVLNRHFVFAAAADPIGLQFLRFVAINLIGLAQTLIISLVLAVYVLPSAGWTWHAETVAHAVGIAVPVATSFLGHKYFSFRQARSS